MVRALVSPAAGPGHLAQAVRSRAGRLPSPGESSSLTVSTPGFPTRGHGGHGPRLADSGPDGATGTVLRVGIRLRLVPCFGPGDRAAGRLAKAGSVGRWPGVVRPRISESRTGSRSGTGFCQRWAAQ